MFDEKEIQTYRSILAPTDLKSKVLESVEIKAKKPYFTLGSRTSWSFAACLVLVIAVLTTANFRDTSIMISGRPVLTKRMVSIQPEYDVVPLRIQHNKEEITTSVAFSIKLNLSKETQISVSEGEMQLTINDTVSSGTTFTVKKQATVIWYVTPDDSDNTFVMTLKSDSKSETLTLDYDEITQNWTVSRQVKH